MEGNPPVVSTFPAQRASNTDTVCCYQLMNVDNCRLVFISSILRSDNKKSFKISSNIFAFVQNITEYLCLRLFNWSSLWPSDVIWRLRSGSTSAQVMARCLTASSHHLNKCWFIINGALRHLPERAISQELLLNICPQFTFLNLHHISQRPMS